MEFEYNPENLPLALTIIIVSVGLLIVRRFLK